MIRRLTMVAVLVAGGMLTMLSAPHANAIPYCKAGYSCLYIFYSTIERTTEVGYNSIPCGGMGSSGGETSAYFTFTETACNL
jgi:hypothetical protein